MGDAILGPTSHYYYSQRLKLHYVDWGNASRPPLLPALPVATPALLRRRTSSTS